MKIKTKKKISYTETDDEKQKDSKWKKYTKNGKKIQHCRNGWNRGKNITQQVLCSIRIKWKKLVVHFDIYSDLYQWWKHHHVVVEDLYYIVYKLREMKQNEQKK